MTAFTRSVVVMVVLGTLGTLGSTQHRSNGQEFASPIRSSEIIESFDMFNDGDVIVVPVILNENTFHFVLGTGTFVNIFDKSLKPLLGPVRYKAVDGASEAIEFFDPPRAFVGKLKLQTDMSPVACTDLNALSQVYGFRLDGIIGMPFLKDQVFILDFDYGKLIFLKSTDLRAATALPITVDEKGPRVNTVVPGLGLTTFYIDTRTSGFGNGDLRVEDFDFLTNHGAIRVLKSGVLLDIHQTTKTKFGVLSDISIFDKHYTDLIFSDHRGPTNNLGLGFLMRHNVTFDFKNQVMYLRDRTRIAKQDYMDLSGLHLLRKADRVVVEFVDDGSPGFRAGIQPKDMLLKIDGNSTDPMRLHVLRLQLCLDGKEIRLAVQRGEKTFDVVLSLPKQPTIKEQLDGNKEK